MEPEDDFPNKRQRVKSPERSSTRSTYALGFSEPPAAAKEKLLEPPDIGAEEISENMKGKGPHCNHPEPTVVSPHLEFQDLKLSSDQTSETPAAKIARLEAELRGARAKIVKLKNGRNAAWARYTAFAKQHPELQSKNNNTMKGAGRSNAATCTQNNTGSSADNGPICRGQSATGNQFALPMRPKKSD